VRPPEGLSGPVKSPDGLCHCFLKLSNNDTLGAYNAFGILYTKKNNTDDTHPRNQPACSDLPGSECKVRQLFEAFPKFQIYSTGGQTSNSLPITILNWAHIDYTLPQCAWGLPYQPTLPFPFI
jgi:hypothetical protein